MVDSTFATERTAILHSKRAAMKQFNQGLMTNSYSTEVNEEGLRISIADIGYVPIKKELTEDFFLAIKHNAAFCALLPALAQHYRCLAIVRNPLAVLLSWESLDIPVRTGNIPVGQALDKELDLALADCPTILDKQLCILSWYFSQFRNTLGSHQIVPYEGIIASGGQSLFTALDIPSSEPIHLESKNKNPAYPAEKIESLTNVLVQRTDIYRGFYTASEIITLAKEYID